MKQFVDAFDKDKFKCYPQITREQQPWNGADSYLYNHLVKENLLKKGTRIIILNDETGVLTYLLREFNPTVTADSIYAKESIRSNFENNGEALDQYTFVDSVSFADLPLENFDIVLMKIPKSSRYMVDQIATLGRCTSKETLYFSAGMVKHISKHTANTLTKRIGETLVHRVEKKAILFSSKKKDRQMKERSKIEFDVSKLGTFTSYSNTFSIGKLDKGTGALLENIPLDLTGTVVDLGCGYGVITRYLQQNCPDITELVGVDVSRMATESTILNVKDIRVIWDDGLSSFDDDSIDAVVSNPPFHLDNSFSVNMGLRLMKQTAKKLKVGGKFIMVANSGLNYKPYLTKQFRDVTKLFSDGKYTVFMATK